MRLRHSSENTTAPDERRRAVEFLVRNKGLSERRAARLVGVSRTVLRYKGRLRDDSKLRRAIQRIAQAKRAYGYRMVGRKLRQQGLQVNHKCVYRIYREEKLGLRRKRRRKTPEHLRVVIPAPEAPNICWSEKRGRYPFCPRTPVRSCDRRMGEKGSVPYYPPDIERKTRAASFKEGGATGGRPDPSHPWRYSSK